jgi:hypothetical protein
MTNATVRHSGSTSNASHSIEPLEAYISSMCAQKCGDHTYNLVILGRFAIEDLR